MNKQRQTWEQKIMREHTAILYSKHPYGTPLRKVAMKVWKDYPAGTAPYKNFDSFLESVRRLGLIFTNDR